jgi:hypothetical protein
MSANRRGQSSDMVFDVRMNPGASPPSPGTARPREWSRPPGKTMAGLTVTPSPTRRVVCRPRSRGRPHGGGEDDPPGARSATRRTHLGGEAAEPPARCPKRARTPGAARGGQAESRQRVACPQPRPTPRGTSRSRHGHRGSTPAGAPTLGSTRSRCRWRWWPLEVDTGTPVPVRAEGGRATRHVGSPSGRSTRKQLTVVRAPALEAGGARSDGRSEAALSRRMREPAGPRGGR